MKYLGKLLLEGVVITLAVGFLLVVLLYFFKDKLIEILGG